MNIRQTYFDVNYLFNRFEKELSQRIWLEPRLYPFSPYSCFTVIAIILPVLQRLYTNCRHQPSFFVVTINSMLPLPSTLVKIWFQYHFVDVTVTATIFLLTSVLLIIYRIQHQQQIGSSLHFNHHLLFIITFTQNH